MSYLVKVIFNLDRFFSPITSFDIFLSMKIIRNMTPFRKPTIVAVYFPILPLSAYLCYRIYNCGRWLDISYYDMSSSI
jgi:hypothetical protein